MDTVLGPLLLAILATGILAGIVRLIAHHREVEEQRDDARRRNIENMTFLTDFTSKLGAVEEVHEALQLVAHHLADECDAESLAIFVDRSDRSKRQLQGAAVAGPFPTFRPAPAVVQRRPQYRLQHLLHEVFAYGETAIGIVAERRESILVEFSEEANKSFALPRGVHTFMAVPMIVEDTFLGVVCAANRKTVGRGFTLEHLNRLELLSCQAALACNLVSIYADRSVQQRLHQEMDFAATTEPAREVGGDYYDFIEIDEHQTMVVVADAAGKGVSACMLMAMCRAFVRCMAESYTGLESFLIDLNRRLYADTASHHFVTMAVVVIDSRDGVCEFGCAGHTPLIMRMASGRCVSVRPSGPALGMLPNDFGVEFETLSFRIHAGMQILIHTDGITEACNEDEEEFEFERLFQVWEQNVQPAGDFLKTLREQLRLFVGQAEQYDDQTVVAIDFTDPAEDEVKEPAHVGESS
jgi:hypothetical protein